MTHAIKETLKILFQTRSKTNTNKHRLYFIYMGYSVSNRIKKKKRIGHLTLTVSEFFKSFLQFLELKP